MPAAEARFVRPHRVTTRGWRIRRGEPLATEIICLSSGHLPSPAASGWQSSHPRLPSSRNRRRPSGTLRPRHGVGATHLAGSTWWSGARSCRSSAPTVLRGIQCPRCGPTVGRVLGCPPWPPADRRRPTPGREVSDDPSDRVRPNHRLELTGRARGSAADAARLPRGRCGGVEL